MYAPTNTPTPYVVSPDVYAVYPLGPDTVMQKEIKKKVLFIRVMALIGVISFILFVVTNGGAAIAGLTDVLNKPTIEWTASGITSILLLISVTVPIVWFVCINLQCLLGSNWGLCLWPCGNRPVILEPSQGILGSFTSCCCVFNRNVPLVVSHACCIPYRLFGYAALPLLCGKFMGPGNFESDVEYLDRAKAAAWGANPSYPMVPVFIINVILLIIIVADDSGVWNIIALVISIVTLVLALFNCFKTCKYDRVHVPDEQARISTYGWSPENFNERGPYKLP